MSRGLGSIQRYLMKLIWSSPDLVEIMAVAFPEGSYEFDIAKVVGGSNVGLCARCVEHCNGFARAAALPSKPTKSRRLMCCPLRPRATRYHDVAE